MSQRIAPSSLQAFNNDLVKGLESLRDQRDGIAMEIMTEERNRDEIQKQLRELNKKLEGVNEFLGKKYAVKNEYDRLIQDTEAAYSKIVESSQTLLAILQRDIQQLSKS